MHWSANAKRARPLRDPGGRRSRGRALIGRGPWQHRRSRQLPLVVVLATVAGVAATAAVATVVDAVVLAVVDAVVIGVVIAVEVALEAVFATVTVDAAVAEADVAEAPFAAPAAMQPVRIAAAATPATPAARRARRAGCGRRRRVVVWVGAVVEVMSYMIEQLSGTILRTASVVALTSGDGRRGQQVVMVRLVDADEGQRGDQRTYHSDGRS